MAVVAGGQALSRTVHQWNSTKLLNMLFSWWQGVVSWRPKNLTCVELVEIHRQTNGQRKWDRNFYSVGNIYYRVCSKKVPERVSEFKDSSCDCLCQKKAWTWLNLLFLWASEMSCLGHSCTMGTFRFAFNLVWCAIYIKKKKKRQVSGNLPKSRKGVAATNGRFQCMHVWWKKFSRLLQIILVRNNFWQKLKAFFFSNTRDCEI